MGRRKSYVKIHTGAVALTIVGCGLTFKEKKSSRSEKEPSGNPTNPTEPSNSRTDIAINPARVPTVYCAPEAFQNNRCKWTKTKSPNTDECGEGLIQVLSYERLPTEEDCESTSQTNTDTSTGPEVTVNPTSPPPEPTVNPAPPPEPGVTPNAPPPGVAVNPAPPAYCADEENSEDRCLWVSLDKYEDGKCPEGKVEILSFEQPKKPEECPVDL